MSTWNPLLDCSRPTKIILLSASLVGSVALITMIVRRTRSLRPNLVALELASTPQEVDEILGLWGTAGCESVRHAQRLDNLFIVFYSSLLAFCSFWLSATTDLGRSGRITVGVWMGWGAWIAGLFDYLENYGMAKELSGARGFWPLFTSTGARIKWALLVLVVAWLLIAAAWAIRDLNG